LLQVFCAAIVVGALVYSILSIIAALRYIAVRPPALTNSQPISILKPLAGMDEGLEENLRSFFFQDYLDFEILFAVRQESDPAVGVVRKFQAEFPSVRSQLLIVGEPPYANAKVWSLDHMLRAARHELLVMSDSDIRVTPDLLRVIAAEFQDPKLGVATCPYRAVPGRSLWSKLEATGMNTDFWAGALTARMLEGVKFAVGPTIAARKRAIAKIGGFERVNEYLAEDFVIGQFADQAGEKVILSSYVIEHRIGTSDFAKNISHRLRWVRSTRRSRPAGYVGQLFTMPFALALILLLVKPAWWPLAAAAIITRWTAAYVVSRRVLRARIPWHLLPLEDTLTFCFWIAGFFGNTIDWRGRNYRLLKDGRFELIERRG
jgi:ceramide glucosyltransferase